MLKRTINQITVSAKNFANNEQGAVAIEYGLIVALIATAVIGGLREVGTSLTLTFDAINKGFSHLS